jgi:hypothetical protein
MSWEDLYWDTYNEMKDLGLSKEFGKQLKKMSSQEKHKYKDTRARWDYARVKVINKDKKKK